MYDHALHLLRQVIGSKAVFRPGQWEAIQALVERHERVLVVQRTGWGKSIVYFLATRLLRDQGQGITLLISPLLALMRNQIMAAEKLGVRAATINSTNRDDWDRIEAALQADQVDLLLVSPERLRNEQFQQSIWQVIRERIGLLAVDEAHCISDWGHDFRPDYRRILWLLDELPSLTPILGTTATANDRVVQDVASILEMGIHVLRGPLTRDSLHLYTLPQPLSKAERLILLDKMLKRVSGSGIIYCATTFDCQQVAEWLQLKGWDAKPYYSGVERDLGMNREALEAELLANQVKALVASVALGMGFDKPDLHFVIHYQYPGSIISYYQQIGRAGRAIEEARIVLMHGEEDRDIQQYFIETAFPTRQAIEQTLALFAERGILKNTDIERKVNARRSVVDKILLHLELEQIIVHTDEGYQLTGLQHEPDYARWAKVTQQRYEELAQMQRYIVHEGCLMHFIAETLDDGSAPQTCGKCQNCTGQRIRSAPTPDELNEAQRFLSRQNFLIFDPLLLE